MEIIDLKIKLAEMLDEYDQKWGDEPYAILIPYYNFMQYYRDQCRSINLTTGEVSKYSKKLEYIRFKGIGVLPGEIWQCIPKIKDVSSVMMDG
jgi:hypothetical protein